MPIMKGKSTYYKKGEKRIGALQLLFFFYTHSTRTSQTHIEGEYVTIVKQTEHML